MSFQASDVPAPARAAAPATWTCPFCPLLCDTFTVATDAALPRLSLQGSNCSRAQAALAQFDHAFGATMPLIDGQACTLDEAVDRAAQLLRASRQPLFGGLGTDVAGARALYRLACATGAISDPAGGEALMHGLRALQDRGAFTTTLAEVRNRADLIVCIGCSPAFLHPEFFRRIGWHEAQAPGEARTRHLVVLGAADAVAPLAASSEAGDGLVPLEAVPGVQVERVQLAGDLFDAMAALAARVASPAAAAATSADAGYAVDTLAARLHAARYAVIVWQGGTLPAHGALIVEAIQRIVNTLNRTTRAAAFPLGGGDGAATVNQVFAWLSGLPLRSRSGPRGLEHDPVCFSTTRLLAQGAVDSLLWVHSFNAQAGPPDAAVPQIVLGHAGMSRPSPTQQPSVFIPVSTPGIGSDGHLFRTDGVVLLPLHAALADGLPTVADVVSRITQALHALSFGDAGGAATTATASTEAHS
jgi:formylmethanofuran dehydrogenase subunit B